MMTFAINLISVVAALVLIATLATLFSLWLSSFTKFKITHGGKKIEVDLSNIEEAATILSRIAGSPRVFVSYAHEDTQMAMKIAQYLREQKIRVWLNEEEIQPGDSLKKKIEEGLNTSDYFLALLSESSTQSEWVRKEWKAAIDHGRQGKWPKVIPVLIGDTEPPAFMADIKYADARKDYTKAINDIVNVIKKNNTPQTIASNTAKKQIYPSNEIPLETIGLTKAA